MDVGNKSPKRERNTKVVRIPKEIYKEAEKLRNQRSQHPKDGSDPFAILAIVGISAFIGGLIGYAIANLQQQEQQQSDVNKKMKGGEEDE